MGVIALLEREQELARLADAVDAVAAGEFRLVSVEGPPGAGKSALLTALGHAAAGRGIDVLRAIGLELEAAYPFGVIRQLLEPVTSALDSARRRRVFAGSAGLSEALLSGVSRPGQVADPGFALLHSLYWVLVGLSDLSPLALIVDDVQWADSLSMQFLAFVLGRAEELPLLLGVGKRDGAASGASDQIAALTSGRAALIRPAPLSDAAIATLLSNALGREPKAEMVLEAARLTEGNPLYLRELVEALMAAGPEAKESEDELMTVAVPSAVGRRVENALARLDGPTQRIGRATAILGDDVPLRRAAALAEVDPEQASNAADALTGAQVLAVGEPLRFRHPLIRQAVLESIKPRQRALLHGRAARLLTHEGEPPELAAVHLLESDPAADGEVVETLRAAARRASNESALPLALSSLRRALREPPDPSLRPVILKELALAEANAGDPLALKHFEEAFTTAASLEPIADGAVRYAMLLTRDGKHGEAEDLMDRVLSAIGDRERRLMLQANMCTLLTINDVPSARARLAQASDGLPGSTPAERVLLGLRAIDLANTRRIDAAGTARRVEAALGDGFLLDEVGPDSPTYLQLLGALPWLEEAEQTERELAAAVIEARRRGAWFGFAVASSMLATQSWKQGQLARAEADVRAAAEVAKQMGWLAGFPLPVTGLIDVLSDKGDFEEADRLLEEYNLAGPLPYSHIHTELLGARGRLRLAQGRTQQGIDDLEEQGIRLEKIGDQPANLRALHAKSLVPSLAQHGQAERGRKIAHEALRLARSFGRPRYIAGCLYAGAFAHAGGTDLEALREAASIYEQLDARLDLARSLLKIGRTLRHRRQPAAARDPLRRALDLARGCGARPLAERTEHELRAAGAKPRRDRITGRDALTATERRVAQLAINGMSNRQIAESLFVTRKTVESHLEHIFRKLDIHARTDLEQALTAAEELSPVA